MKSQIGKLLFIALGSLILSLACNKPNPPEGGNILLKSMDNEVYREWNSVFLELERFASGYRPGPSARILAYMGLSAYEASLGGMPQYKTLRFRLGIPDLPAIQTNLYWPEVINASYAYLMRKAFENVIFVDKNKNKLDSRQFMKIIESKEAELRDKYLSSTIESTLINSESYGREVASAIWQYSISDGVGYNAHLNPYPNIANSQVCKWVPTDPADSDKGLFPQWGQVRRFALNFSDLDALAAPFNCDSDTNSINYIQAAETRTLSQSAKNDPSGDLQHSAEFWSDDVLGLTFSPTARIIAIADQIIEAENINLEQSCLLYAQIGLALNDVSVLCFYNKYKFNVERPVTYIKREIDPNFNLPWLAFTPPHPSYPSEHASYATAGMTILEAYAGENYPFVDKCHELRTEFNGTPRSFARLRDLADESGFSRLPLGVHYKMDQVGGNFCGALTAQKVLELPWKK